MKKFLFLLLTATLWPALRVGAQDVLDDSYTATNGIVYTLDDDTKTAAVSAQGKTSGNTENTTLSGDITIPEKVSYNDTEYMVTSLADYAFYYFSSITSIDLPSTIISLGAYCFRKCSSLTSIELPNSITSLGMYCFYGCSSLTSISLPNSITTLGDNCFYWCTNLISIDLSATSLTSLPEYCFDSCTNLTSIDLPTTLTSLGSYCFASCNKLTSIDLPAGITSLPDYCFFDCSTLTSIELPNNVTSLGDYCFLLCYSLESITLPDCIRSLGNFCFEFCVALPSIDLPTTLTSLGSGCFSFCISLTSITLPSSLTSLGDYCFAVSGLTSIDLHNGIPSLPNYCFLSCTSLTSVDLPKSIGSLGDHCFSACTNLSSFDIPKSITSVGDYCFSGCSSLNIIACEWGNLENDVTIGSDVLSEEDECYIYEEEDLTIGNLKTITADGVPSTCKLYVPIGMKDTYLTAIMGSDYSSYFTESNIIETDEVTNFHIKNPGFEYGDSRAWAYAGVENESATGDAGVKAVSSTDDEGNSSDGSVDDYIFYALYDDGTQTEDLHQMIKLPAGNYILSAKVAYDHSASTSTATDFAQIYIQDSDDNNLGYTNVDAHEGQFVESAVRFSIGEDDTFVKIGIRRNAPWLKVDDIHLYYYKDDAEYAVEGSDETTSFAKKYDAVANNKNVSVSISAGKFAGRIFPFRPVSIMEANPETNTAESDRTGIYNNVTVYTCGGFSDDGSALTLTEVADLSTLEANVPYFFYNNTESAISVTLCDAAAAPIYESYSAGDQTLSLTGVHAQTKVEKPTSGTNYVLQTKNGEQKLYPVGENGVNISAYRTYLTDASTDASAKALSLSFEDASATAIEAIEAVEALTSDNAEIYDLSGRKLSKLQKGINIVNGHKIMVK